MTDAKAPAPAAERPPAPAGTASRLDPLLAPTSIAVLGASRSTQKYGGKLIPALRSSGYGGRIVPVNPSYDEIDGLRCYPRIGEVPDPVDHALVVLPRDAALGALRECRAADVGAATVFSAGFAELGDETGARTQRELIEAADGMPFLGPNCMGFANLHDGIVAANALALIRNREPGRVSVISQSGSLAFASFAYMALEARLRLSYVVSTGNTVGVDVPDLVDYVARDRRSDVVLLILESNEIAAAVLERRRDADPDVTMVLLKLGRGATGTAMASSHTGSLAGDYELVRDCAEQLGVVCVDDLAGALHAVTLLEGGVRARHARGVCALSISGGNATLLADAMDERELRFSALSGETHARLRELLPPYISVNNPIDLTVFGIDHYGLHKDIIDVLAADESVQLVVPILTTLPDYRGLCRLLADAASELESARVAVVWNGGSMQGDEAFAILRDAGVPVLPSASALTDALLAVGRADGSALDDGAPPTRDAAREGAHATTESEALALLAAVGVPVVPWRLVARDQLEAAAAAVGYPVVVKADSLDTHISDAGGVITDIRDARGLAAVRERVTALPGEKVLVTRFLGGVELIGSAFWHPLFGPVLMVGTGGRLADAVRDVRFVRLPASRERVDAALARTALGRALRAGTRELEGFDAAVELLAALGRLVVTDPTIQQAELNPILVGAHGAAAVDAAVMRA